MRGEPVHHGQYQLVLGDNTKVVLLPPYMEAAIRPAKEVEQLEGKLVKVTGSIVGTLYMEEPTADREPQSVNILCFYHIESIQLAE